MAKEIHLGKVEIPLQDYIDLTATASVAEERYENLLEISRQLAIFLSGLVREKVVYDEIAVFNARSSECQIHIVDNRVKIELKDK